MFGVLSDHGIWSHDLSVIIAPRGFSWEAVNVIATRKICINGVFYSHM